MAKAIKELLGLPKEEQEFILQELLQALFFPSTK